MNFWTTRQKNWRIQSNISGYIGPTLVIVLSYESNLGADDPSVPYFPIRQIMWGEEKRESNKCRLILPAFFAASI